MNVSMTHS